MREVGGLRPEYHQLQWAGRPGWWRPVVGMVVVGLTMFLLVPLVIGAVLVGIWALAGHSPTEVWSQVSSTTQVTPLTLLFLNLALAAGIPIVWAVNKLLHNLKPKWLSSVHPRIRWRYLIACLGIAAMSLLATLVVSALLPSGGGAQMEGRPQPFDNTMLQFVLIVLFLTPLQAAAEEYVFRGYFTQSFGGLTGSRIVAVVGPAILFALAHGLGQPWPVFIDRLAFGLVAGVLVIVTGGLEAGIAMHILNNFLAFSIALAYGQMDSALTPGEASWWMVPQTLTQSLVYLGLATLVARRMGISNRGPAIPAAHTVAPGPTSPVVLSPPPESL